MWQRASVQHREETEGRQEQRWLRCMSDTLPPPDKTHTHLRYALPLPPLRVERGQLHSHLQRWACCRPRRACATALYAAHPLAWHQEGTAVSLRNAVDWGVGDGNRIERSRATVERDHNTGAACDGSGSEKMKEGGGERKTFSRKILKKIQGTRIGRGNIAKMRDMMWQTQRRERRARETQKQKQKENGKARMGQRGACLHRCCVSHRGGGRRGRRDELASRFHKAKREGSPKTHGGRKKEIQGENDL